MIEQMTLYRLTQDWHGLFEGVCVTEAQFEAVFFADKALFEPICDYDKKKMLEYEDDSFCSSMGVQCLLFWSEKELNIFLDKLENAKHNN